MFTSKREFLGTVASMVFSSPSRAALQQAGPIIDPWGTPLLGTKEVADLQSSVFLSNILARSHAFSKNLYFLVIG